VPAKPTVRSAFRILSQLDPPRPPGKPKPPAKATTPWLGPCEPPQVRVDPEFRLFFDRAVLLETVGEQADASDDSDDRAIRPAWAPDVEPMVAVLLRLEQVWSLRELCIGDLSTTFGLAPSEVLTLEVITSQRRLLDQTTVDSREELNSTENTTLDKEVMNVAHSSSKTEKWGVNGNASFSLGGLFKLGAGADYSRTITSTTQTSQQQIHEATTKSSHSLKTLHKVEVRSVTETEVRNRSVRTIRNPYYDRTLAVSVFSLLKRFEVVTRLSEVRPAMVFDLSGLAFNEAFVLQNAEFLRQEVLDPQLAESVPFAVQGALPAPTSEARERARRAGRQAMDLLFQRRNIFNLEEGGLGNPNDVRRSFDAQAVDHAHTGFGDSEDNGKLVLFTMLNVFFRLYEGLDEDDERPAQAADLAVALADAVDMTWSTLTAPSDGNLDGPLLNVLDNESLTEPFRRLGGFLALVKGVVKPALTAAAPEEAAGAVYQGATAALSRLLDHLEYHRDHYVRRYLAYLSTATSGAAFVAFAESALERFRTGTGGDEFTADVLGSLDLDRVFVDGARVVVPSAQPVTDGELNALINALTGRKGSFKRDAVTPLTDAIELPADGVHLEVAPGTCPLDDPAPPPPQPPPATVVLAAATPPAPVAPAAPA
jgi:hypothetical protein